MKKQIVTNPRTPKRLLSLALAFALIAAFFPTQTAFAATKSVTTYAELSSAISGAANGDVINIEADIDVTSGATFYSSSSNGRTITVNGNGHTLRQTGSTSMFKFHYGTVTFNDIIFDGNNRRSTSFKYGGSAISGRYAAITVNNCVFMNNYTSGSSTGGGAVSVQNSSGRLTVTNSTFVGNYAEEDGGAIYSGAPGTITNCTFYGNQAEESGGAVRNSSSTSSGTGQTVMINCIAIGNTAKNASEGHDIYRANDGGYNLFGTAVNLTNAKSTTKTEVTNASGWLDTSLKDNGGVNGTLTLALKPTDDSPAINKGTSSGAPALDQRGVPRDAQPDIGAYEYRLAKVEKTIKTGEIWDMSEIDPGVAHMLEGGGTYSQGYESIITVDPVNKALIKGIGTGTVTIEAIESGFKVLDVTVIVESTELTDKVTDVEITDAPENEVGSEIPFTLAYAVESAGDAQADLDWLVTLADGAPLPENVLYAPVRTTAASGTATLMLVNEPVNGDYFDYEIKITAKSTFDFTQSDSIYVTLKKPADTAVIGVSLSADAYDAQSEERVELSYLISSVVGEPADTRIRWTVERPSQNILVNGLTDGEISDSASGKLSVRIRNNTDSQATIKITASSVDNPYRSASVELRITGVSKQVTSYNELYRTLRDAKDGDSISIGADLYAQKVTYLDGVDAVSSASINSATRSLQSALSVAADVTIEGNGHTIDGGGYYAIFYLKSGTLTIRNLTITNSNNTNTSSSEKQGSAICAKNGAGLIILENVTIQNCKTDVGNGAALYIDAGSEAKLKNCTIADNTSKYGGAIYSANGKLSIENSIVLRNRAGTQGDDIYFSPATAVNNFTDLGYNLFYDCVSGSGSGSSATQFPNTAFHATSLQKEQIDTYSNWLAPTLAQNGGHVKTVALLNVPQSPAIDKIPAGRYPKTDERGILRTGLGDIGAYELYVVTGDISMQNGEKILLDNYFKDNANAAVIIDGVSLWTSDDKTVATADVGYGYVTAHGEGATTIHGFNQSGGEVVAIRVFVGDRSIGDISIASDATRLDSGEPASVNYDVTGNPSADKSLIWTAYEYDSQKWDDQLTPLPNGVTAIGTDRTNAASGVKEVSFINRTTSKVVIRLIAEAAVNSAKRAYIDFTVEPESIRSLTVTANAALAASVESGAIVQIEYLLDASPSAENRTLTWNAQGTGELVRLYNMPETTGPNGQYGAVVVNNGAEDAELTVTASFGTLPSQSVTLTVSPVAFDAVSGATITNIEALRAQIPVQSGKTVEVAYAVSNDVSSNYRWEFIQCDTDDHDNEYPLSSDLSVLISFDGQDFIRAAEAVTSSTSGAFRLKVDNVAAVVSTIVIRGYAMLPDPYSPDPDNPNMIRTAETGFHLTVTPSLEQGGVDPPIDPPVDPPTDPGDGSPVDPPTDPGGGSPGSSSGGSGGDVSAEPAIVSVINEVGPALAAAPTPPFTDVSSGAWYYGDVEYVFANGLMNGTAADSFSPNASATRGMIVTILYRLAGSPDVSGPGNTFNDVTGDKYYFDAVNWASANGVVLGYDGGGFGPDDDITREQLAVILARYAGFAGTELPTAREYSVFADADNISGYAKEAVEAFFKAGVINGKGGNTFDPKGNATRAEIAAMLHRLSEVTE
jgi:predicted outer membrane repeat protein